MVPKKALILSGGGARGAYEAGVVSELLKHETFDIICGTSIGALNGMVIAQGAGAEIVEFWRTIARRDVARFRPELKALMKLWDEVRALTRDSALNKPARLLGVIQSLPNLSHAKHLQELRGIFDGVHVRDVMREIADLSAVKSTFICGVTNLSTARGNAFAYFPTPCQEEDFFFVEHDAHKITAENYVDAVCASAAIPPAYEPLEILCADGVTRVFADGAFTNNAPIRQAIDAGATEITAIFLNPANPCVEEHKVETIAHVATLMLEANLHRMLDLDLKLARRINDAVVAGLAPTKRFVDLRLICPRRAIDLPALNFNDYDAIEKLIDRGREDAALQIAGERAAGGAQLASTTGAAT